MKNEEYIKYTYIHRKVVIYLANKYFKDNKDLLEQIKFHDMDKLFMYLFYNKKDASKVHRNLSIHHDNELPKTNLDYIEMVLDWESARYTKDDKPLNAFDTLYGYYKDMEDKILPILKEMNIDKSNLPKEEDVLNYSNSLKNVTLNEIKEELKEYIEEMFK